MNKGEFLVALRAGLSGLPQPDVDERVSFYEEMIEDRIEEGMTEEDAVAAVGSVDSIVSQVVASVPIAKLVKERITPKRSLETWEIVLIVLGFPLWFPLLIAIAAVVLSLYVVLFSVVLSLWTVEISLWAGALAGPVLGLMYLLGGTPIVGAAGLGIGLLCAGVSILLFFGCTAATKGIIRLAKRILLGIKKQLIRKENEK